MKKPTRRYRGKYPTRIKMIYSVAGRMIAVTNDGTTYAVKPVTAKGSARIPQLGKVIGLYQQSADYEVTP